MVRVIVAGISVSISLLYQPRHSIGINGVKRSVFVDHQNYVLCEWDHLGGNGRAVAEGNYDGGEAGAKNMESVVNEAALSTHTRFPLETFMVLNSTGQWCLTFLVFAQKGVLDSRDAFKLVDWSRQGSARRLIRK